MKKNNLLVALSLCIMLSVCFLSGCTQEHRENIAKMPVATEAENNEEVSAIEEMDTNETSGEEEPDNADEDSAEEQRRAEEEYRKNNLCIDSVKVRESQVKLRWSRMEPGNGYKIYRYDGEVEGRKKQNLIATLSKDTCSYTDKDVAMGKNYIYEVVCTDEQKDGKVEILSNDIREVSIGPGRCEWTDNGPSSPGTQFDTTTRYIRLQFGVLADAMKQDGFEIYRGKSKKDMKKIAVVESAKKQKAYKDTDVTPFATYYYKVRSYKKIDGKTYYGFFSEKQEYTAINSRGKFVIEKGTDWKQKKQKEHIIKMTSDQGNYDFEINKYLFSHTWESEDVAEHSNYQISDEFENVQYSFDGADWKDFTEERVKVSKGESIYLLLRKKDSQAFQLDTKIYAACYYDTYPAVLQIDFHEDSPIGETEYEYMG